ncbi:MAG: methyltransferase domain-containing protein [Acidobacteria bacterium]|nr:methyltransferase domain-containing protein [Acidobacteriota bacterium]
MAARQGWHGWDEYAPFYDWENARTLGRRDVAFWRQIARAAAGRVLELGCGTGRVSLPLARAGIELVGIDRSSAMLARLRARAGARGRRGPSPDIVRGDIRRLPFAAAAFAAVIAPYGILQSLLSDRDLQAALESAARVLPRGGVFGVDLVPDVPKWPEYTDRVQHRGRAAAGAHFTLLESVRQDRRRRLTTFEQQYLVRRRGRTMRHRFALTFRSLSVPQMSRRLDKAGFAVESVLGDYRGRPWDPRADVWIILAKKR